jgi:hypothetical protein
MTSQRASEREPLASVLGGGTGRSTRACRRWPSYSAGWPESRLDQVGVGGRDRFGVARRGRRVLREHTVRAARNAVVSLAAVIVAALVAPHTGRAHDFFLIQLLSNVASALLCAASVAARWPLLGVVVSAAKAEDEVAKRFRAPARILARQPGLVGPVSPPGRGVPAAVVGRATRCARRGTHRAHLALAGINDRGEWLGAVPRATRGSSRAAPEGDGPRRGGGPVAGSDRTRRGSRGTVARGQ